MHSLFRLLAGAACAILLLTSVACRSAPPPDAYAPGPAVGPSAGSTDPAPWTPEALEARALTETIAVRSRTWDEADRDLRLLLSTYADDPTRPLVEHEAARTLLGQLPPDDEAPLTPTQREAVSYYTRLLLAQDAPDAALVAPALEELEGYWSEDERAYYAHHALERTRDAGGPAEQDARPVLERLAGRDE